jgi:hypothetical protein
MCKVNFVIETGCEDDNGSTAEVPPNPYAPRAHAYGTTCGQAMIKAEALVHPTSSSC